MRIKIEAAIAAAEAKSRAEFVAVIGKRASEYRATGFALATLIAFLGGIVAWLTIPWVLARDILLGEFAIFLLALAAFELTPLGDYLTPTHLKKSAAQRWARAVFLEQGLASTAERNAVLFFVSAAEHHVEIIADRALSEKVPPGKWQEIVDGFAKDVRAGAIEKGYLDAIARLTEIVSEHFPAAGPRENVIGNRLIEL
ncbi:TPM domain-containing protein [Dongia sp.]|uniref:TPM domain-containing protein n=1 Tax=Dongia sp. TaxID=1977262 RepID=UPI0035AFEC46